MPGTPGRPEVLGDIAHDSPETSTSFPVKIGGVAKNQDGTTPGFVAEDDRVNAIFSLDGRQYVNIGHPFFFSTSPSYSVAQTNAQVVAAPSAGLSLYLTDFVCTSSTLSSISVVENTGAAVTKLTINLGAGGGNFGYSFRNPIKFTAATNIGVTTSATLTAFVFCGFTAP